MTQESPWALLRRNVVLETGTLSATNLPAPVQKAETSVEPIGFVAQVTWPIVTVIHSSPQHRGPTERGLHLMASSFAVGVGAQSSSKLVIYMD